jgi:hypothetical protein
MNHMCGVDVSRMGLPLQRRTREQKWRLNQDAVVLCVVPRCSELHHGMHIK